MTENDLIHRQHAQGTTLNWINTLGCWHLDVWLYLDSVGCVYVKALTSQGGKVVIGQQWFALVLDTTFGVYKMAPVTGGPDRAGLLVLNTPPATRALGQWQNDIFWRLLWPLTTLWPRGQYKRRSVAFHCVKPVEVNDPFEGIVNHYATSARASRDELHAAKLAAGKL